MKPSQFFLASVIFVLFALTPSKNSNAQIGVGTTTPNSSAILDISSNSKGLLIPRMTAAQRTAIGLPSKGLLVYQIDAPEGFYYNSGTIGSPTWVSLSPQSASTNWDLTGNTGTIAGTNYIGTTDAQSLDFRTNSLLRARITTKGQIAIYNTGQSVFIGDASGANDDLNSRQNVFIGDSVGYSNSIGSYNTAIGVNALRNNTNAGANVAIGYYALYTQSFNNGGTYWESNNVAIGYAALLRNQPITNTIYGSNNVAIGRGAMFFNTNGFSNTALGTGALQGNLTGSYNTAIGNGAIANSTSITDNTGIGAGTLNALTTGGGNTALGSSSGNSLTTGSFNTFIGWAVNSDAVNRTNTVSIGGSQCLPLGGDNAVRIGNSSMVSIGGQVGWTILSDERIKENVNIDVKGLSFIMKLRPVTYNYSIEKSNRLQNRKDTIDWVGKYDIEKIKFSGFLAQEVERTANEVGYSFSGIDKPKDKNGLWGLRYSEFVVPLVKAMQEQQLQIEKLQKEVNELTKIVNKKK